MRAAIEKLSKLGGEIYAQAQQAAAAAGAGAGAGPATGPGAGSGPEGAGPQAHKGGEKKSDVVDGDFEVVDDDKKQ